jgi:hypothetical protein
MLALYIIAGIILLIILVLSVPLELKFDLDVRENIKTNVRVGWLFGLVWIDLRARERKRPAERRERQRRLSLFSILRTGETWQRLIRLLRQILGCVKVKQLYARLRIGFDDPADTGMMCAFLWPALTPLTLFESVRFSLEPVFNEPTFEGGLRSRIKLFPIQVLGILLGFVLTPSNWQLLRVMVASNWR